MRDALAELAETVDQLGRLGVEHEQGVVRLGGEQEAAVPGEGQRARPRSRLAEDGSGGGGRAGARGARLELVRAVLGILHGVLVVVHRGGGVRPELLLRERGAARRWRGHPPHVGVWSVEGTREFIENNVLIYTFYKLKCSIK